ncbi:MAG: hypothetical protein WCP16_25820 [Pseudanabaena sp. ELA645]
MRNSASENDRLSTSRSEIVNKRSPRQQRRQYRKALQALLLLLPIIGNALPAFADTYSNGGFALNTNNNIRRYDGYPEMINWTLDNNDPDQHLDRQKTQVNASATMLQNRKTKGCLNSHYGVGSRTNAWNPCDAKDPDMAWFLLTQNDGSVLLQNVRSRLCLQMQSRSDYGFNTMQACDGNNANQKFRINASKVLPPLPLPPSNAVQRAKAWVDQRIPYSQVAYFQGYRQDCSGLVSMAWGLNVNPSPVTSTLPNYSITLTSKDQLLPGDAINNRGIGNGGHVVLFVQWVNKAQGTFIAYEENGGYGRAVKTTLTLDSTPSGFNIREYTSNSIARPWYLERKR